MVQTDYDSSSVLSSGVSVASEDDFLMVEAETESVAHEVKVESNENDRPVNNLDVSLDAQDDLQESEQTGAAQVEKLDEEVKTPVSLSTEEEAISISAPSSVKADAEGAPCDEESSILDVEEAMFLQTEKDIKMEDAEQSEIRGDQQEEDQEGNLGDEEDDDDESLSMPQSADFWSHVESISHFDGEETALLKAQVLEIVAHLAAIKSETANEDNAQVLERICEVLAKHHAVKALQDFLNSPAVFHATIEAAETGSLQQAMVNNMGELFKALADLTLRAPELAQLAPTLFSELVKFMQLFNKPHDSTKASQVQAEMHGLNYSPDTASEANTSDGAKASLPQARHESYTPSVVHRHIVCDGCDSQAQRLISSLEGNMVDGCIAGIRWKSAITEDFDLCSTCENTGRFEEQHGPFLKITDPRKAPRELVVVLREQGSTGATSARCRGRGRRRHNNNNNPGHCFRRRHEARMQQMKDLAHQAEDKLDMPMKCPSKGHLLQRCTPSIGYTCDVCQKSPSFGDSLYGCRLCNWDICMLCADLQLAHALALESGCAADAGSTFEKETSPDDQVGEADAVPPSEELTPANQLVISRPLGKFVADVTIPDGTVLQGGQRFTKMWRIENPSPDQAWPNDVRLVCVGGERMSGPEDGIRVAAIAPQTSTELSVDLTAPMDSGRYVSYWRLMSNGQRFGHRLWIDISVVRKWDEQLRVLDEMGFPADQALLDMLEEEEGNLETLIPRLCC